MAWDSEETFTLAELGAIDFRAEKLEADAMLDIAHEEGLYLAAEEWKNVEERASRLRAQIGALSRSEELTPEDEAALGRASLELDRLDPDEHPEWEHDDTGADYPLSYLVFYEAEDRLHSAARAIADLEAELERRRLHPKSVEELFDPALFPADEAARPESTKDLRRLRRRDRIEVLFRAGRACEICGERQELGRRIEVGHFVSLSDGKLLGLPEPWLNSRENLLAECDECNREHGDETIPLRLAVAILLARSRRAE